MLSKSGLALGVLTYSIWGFFPLYFKLFSGLALDELLAHRVLWSVVFTLTLVLLSYGWSPMARLMRQPRVLLKLFVSATLLAGNWLIFIYATLNNDVLQLSLGYFINPIFNVIFGVLIFRERLNAYASIAIALAVMGMSVQLLQMQEFPVLAMSVALCFSLYGVVRKGVDVEPIPGFLVETLLLLVPALLYLYLFTDFELFKLMGESTSWLVLIFLVGPVTSIPLITFSFAVQRIPYYMVGFCQYITPTMMFVWAIFLYDEHWTHLDLVTFSLVWVGIGFIVFGVFKSNWPQRYF